MIVAPARTTLVVQLHADRAGARRMCAHSAAALRLGVALCGKQSIAEVEPVLYSSSYFGCAVHTTTLNATRFAAFRGAQLTWQALVM